ncbi:MAG: Holliday junction branch migration protein RuvA [Coriobacteriia bacterium]|nr:Holliday junction branch migration protein RuvA [Coriobacteriia bacterium]
MISFLTGRIAAKGFDVAFLDVNGVGFQVFMSANSLAKLPDIGQYATVSTYLQVREDALVLYGFLSEEEKALFEKLISVSGVGPKVALAALSSYSPAQLIDAIMAQDVGRVQKIPGVGKKTASRIILELKGSLEQPAAASSQGATAVDGTLRSVIDALLAMGFTSAEADLAVKDAPDGASEGALLQYALKKLGSQG